MAVELFLDSTATGSRTVFRFYCRFLMAVEVAVEMAVEFQSGSRKKSGSRKAGHRSRKLVTPRKFSSLNFHNGVENRGVYKSSCDLI